jgi:Pectate lyase superfamily protein
VATIDDFGDVDQPLNGPKLGGPDGWAAAVRDSVRELQARPTLPPSGDPGTLGVEAFGAVGDGVTDDTAAIQACIDACAAAGAVAFMPAGVYRVGALTLTHGCFGLVGVGSQVQSQDVFGGAQWADPVLRGGGTVLLSTVTTGAALDVEGRTGPRLARMLILGPGSGTSSGVSTVASDWMVGLQLQDLAVANFRVGLDLSVTYETVSSGLNVRGCHTGIRLADATNQNTFTQTRVQSCTVGIDIDASEQNLFVGGLGQVNVGKSIFVHGTGAHGNVFDTWYFENPGQDIAVHFEAGADFCEVRNSHGSYNVVSDDRIVVDANHCQVINVHLQQVEVNGANCFTMGTAGGLAGVDAPNYLPGFHVDFGSGRASMRGLDIRLDSGRTIWLETVGESSYLRRSGADVHIGNAVSVRGPVGFNSTPPLSKPTIAGSRGGNAALTALLTALASYGLITDSTTA